MAVLKLEIRVEQSIFFWDLLSFRKIPHERFLHSQNVMKLPLVESDEETIKMLKRLNVGILAPDHRRVLQAHQESLLEPYDVNKNF